MRLATFLAPLFTGAACFSPGRSFSRGGESLTPARLDRLVMTVSSPAFSRTKAEEQVTALISSSPHINSQEAVTVDELKDDLLNYCIAGAAHISRSFQDSLIFARDCTEFLLELKLYNLIGI